MSIWISWFIAGTISMYVYYYEYDRIFKKRHHLEKDEITLFLILALINCFAINYFPSIMRIMFSFISIVILISFCFKDKLAKVIMFSALSCTIMAISEMIFATIFVLGFGINNFTDNYFSIISSNILIEIIYLLFFKSKKFVEVFSHIIKWYETKIFLNLVMIVGLGLATITFLLYQNSTGNNNMALTFIANNVLLIAIIVFMIIYFKETSNNNELKYKYDVLFDYAKTYEKEVIEKSKWQHEYENQLIIVKDKISSRNKEARDYIDKLLKDKPIDTNTEWLRRLSKLPDIGIKGLLCYKIGQMQAKGINAFIDISDNLKIEIKHKQVLEKNLQDISKVLGVYIDNAIDAASLSKKKYFIFEFYCTRDTLVFQISNTFASSIDLQRIGNEKFTTKGTGHGYGLSLVKDILANNLLMSQEREINGMYYVQRLIIDTKKIRV